MDISSERVLAAVDECSADLVRFLRELVRAKSITGEEDVAQGVVKDKLLSLGAKVDWWKPTRHNLAGYEPFHAEEKRVGTRPNVVGRFGNSRASRSLAFNGHVDVVPEGDPNLWRHPPYGGVVSDGRLYGRGSCDMKGGLAAAIFALHALNQSAPELKKEFLVESVIGEETGGLGTLATLLRGYVPEATIIAEPTHLNLVTMQAGCLMFRLRISGKAAHGASRYMGVSAVEKFQPILSELILLEARRAKRKKHAIFAEVPNPVPLSVGTVHAGTWDSTVPDELVAEGRYGVWPRESLVSARREFEESVAQASKRDEWLRRNPPTVDWFGPQWEPAEIARDHWLAKLVDQACVGALGERPRRAGITAGTDMRLYTNVGNVPAVVFGPGDYTVAHFSDEWVSIDEVIKECKVYALSALKWNDHADSD